MFQKPRQSLYLKPRAIVQHGMAIIVPKDLLPVGSQGAKAYLARMVNERGEGEGKAVSVILYLPGLHSVL